MNLFEYEQGFARRILMVLYHGETVYCLLQDLWGGGLVFTRSIAEVGSKHEFIRLTD